MAAALCFTVVADWFLLVRDEGYALGIGLFIAAQLIYAFRLCLMRDKLVFSGTFALWLFGLGLAILLAWKNSLVSALACFYFCSLFANEVEAGSRGTPYRGKLHQYPLRRRFPGSRPCLPFATSASTSTIPAFSPASPVSVCGLFTCPPKVLIVLSQELEKGDLDEKNV